MNQSALKRSLDYNHEIWQTSTGVTFSQPEGEQRKTLCLLMKSDACPLSAKAVSTFLLQKIDRPSDRLEFSKDLLSSQSSWETMAETDFPFWLVSAVMSAHIYSSVVGAALKERSGSLEQPDIQVSVSWSTASVYLGALPPCLWLREAIIVIVKSRFGPGKFLSLATMKNNLILGWYET